MSEQLFDTFGVPEIFTDGIAQCHFVNDAMRWVYWSWQMSSGGVLQKVAVAKCVMPRVGVESCRPLITEALQNHRRNPMVSTLSDMTTAH